MEFTNSIGMKFRLIPPGEFMMGMTNGEVEALASLNPKDEGWKTRCLSFAPAHKVRLSLADQGGVGVACRAGTTTPWFHGDHEGALRAVAWFNANSNGRTHAVGQLTANPFGLYEVHGNVWEWCQDWHDAQAYSQRGPGPTGDPQGPVAGSSRVVRGGDWDSNSACCRSAFRDAYGVGHRDHRNGFRVLVGVSVSRSSR